MSGKDVLSRALSLYRPRGFTLASSVLLAALTLGVVAFYPQAVSEQNVWFYLLSSALLLLGLICSFKTGALRLRAALCMCPLLLSPLLVEELLFSFKLQPKELVALYRDLVCLLSIFMVSVLAAACLRELTATIPYLRDHALPRQGLDFLLALPLVGAVGLLPWGYLSSFALTNNMLSDYDLLALIQTDGSEAWYFILDHAAYPLRIAANLLCLTLYALGIWFLGGRSVTRPLRSLFTLRRQADES